jgi:hypothetical protein
MASPPVDFRLLAGAGVAARDFKAGDVIFREDDPARGGIQSKFGAAFGHSEQRTVIAGELVGPLLS